MSKYPNRFYVSKAYICDLDLRKSNINITYNYFT